MIENQYTRVPEILDERTKEFLKKLQEIQNFFDDKYPDEGVFLFGQVSGRVCRTIVSTADQFTNEQIFGSALMRTLTDLKDINKDIFRMLYVAFVNTMHLMAAKDPECMEMLKKVIELRNYQCKGKSESCDGSCNGEGCPCNGDGDSCDGSNGDGSKAASVKIPLNTKWKC